MQLNPAQQWQHTRERQQHEHVTLSCPKKHACTPVFDVAGVHVEASSMQRTDETIAAQHALRHARLEVPARLAAHNFENNAGIPAASTVTAHTYVHFEPSAWKVPRFVCNSNSVSRTKLEIALVAVARSASRQLWQPREGHTPSRAGSSPRPWQLPSFRRASARPRTRCGCLSAYESSTARSRRGAHRAQVNGTREACIYTGKRWKVTYEHRAEHDSHSNGHANGQRLVFQ